MIKKQLISKTAIQRFSEKIVPALELIFGSIFVFTISGKGVFLKI